MALIKSGNIGGSSQGGVNYELHAEQTGGSGNSRTVRVTLNLKLAGNPSYPSWFGYAAQWKGIINGTYNPNWSTVKGTESWNTNDSWRSYSWTHTTDVGTSSSKAITVGFQLNSDGSNLWDTTQTGSFTVGATNTAPTMNGSVTIRNTNSSGSVLSGIIPENVSTLYLSWSAGSDNEQTSGLKYGVNEIVNNGGATTVVYPTTALNATLNIGTGNEGQKRKYYVDCRDNSDTLSTNRADSVELTKNTFTTDTLASSGSIGYSSGSLSFTYSGASNSNGNTTFSRTLSCDGLTVYNPSLAASPATVTIYKSGTVPTTCYIKFDDIKNKFKSNNYTGSLTFKLTTTNAYGTSKTSSKAISVDLRTAPNAATNQVISTSSSESTMYKKVAFANNYYFIPSGTEVARVKWSAGSGKLGEAISYELYVAYGSGSWQKLADLAGTATYYNHTIEKQTVSQQFKYLIRTKNSYGLYSDAITSAQTLHYYNAPSINIGQITRTDTTAEIPVTVLSVSSIPNISTVGTWSGQGTGSLTAAQTEQKINISGLTSNGTYTITVVYNDNTGFSSNQTKEIAVGANLPIMFLNKYGIGIGGQKADAYYSLKVSGSAAIDGDLTINGIRNRYQILGSNVNLDTIEVPGEYIQNLNANTSTALNYPEALAGHLTVTTAAGFQQRYHVYNSSRIYTRAKFGTGAWTAWAKEYNTANKPSATDVGALPIGGGTVTGDLSVSAGKQVSASAYNLNGYKNWSEGDYNTTGDGAAIVNDNGTYKSLMILGNRSADGNKRKIKMWDEVEISGNLKVNGSDVVSSGSNSNGNYVRFCDGTQICWHSYTATMNIGTAYGSLWQNYYSWTHPIAFASTPVANIGKALRDGASWGAINNSSTTSTGFRLMDAFNRPDGSTAIAIMAIGRWK